MHTTTASLGRGSASQAVAGVRGQGREVEAQKKKHMGDIAQLWEEDDGPSWVPGIGSANRWPRRYACS